ncbi:helix-turn-helix domain-containing protein [Streptomyces sp. NPDC087297]|uniref:helix-turn-helix domain-containing protein n=1 Tax=Streptomyces sp. NPDC087297 TaxID=3365778 RepID=UPI00380866FA
MGRPELPVDHAVPARGELATALRGLRTASGLTYDEMAAQTGISPATLKRAASGRIVAAWETVTALVAVCGDPDGAVGHLWQKARIAERGRLAQLRRPGSPELITTRGALSEALEYFYERAGGLPLRRLQALAGGPHLLAVSSAARIVNREALPASRQQCAAFLTACGIGPRLVERWAEAFDRITEAHPVERWADDLDRSVVPRAWAREVEQAVTITLRDTVMHRQRGIPVLRRTGAVGASRPHQPADGAVRLRGTEDLILVAAERAPDYRQKRHVERMRLQTSRAA